MKKLIVTLTIITSMAALQIVRADLLTEWTFETSQPNGFVSGGLAYAPVYSEAGRLGVALGYHANDTAYSSPIGNGSSHAFSSTNWVMGDYYQFSVQTSGYQDINVSFDQASSAAGPSYFILQYSLDGSLFQNFGGDYVVTNTSPTVWNPSTPLDPATTTYAFDLSSITDLNDASAVYFRVVDDSATRYDGGSVLNGGTDRIDNFLVSAIPVPEPSNLAVVLLGGALLMMNLRRRQSGLM